PGDAQVARLYQSPRLPITAQESVSLIQFLQPLFRRLKRFVLSAGPLLHFSEVASCRGVIAATFGNFTEGDQGVQIISGLETLGLLSKLYTHLIILACLLVVPARLVDLSEEKRGISTACSLISNLPAVDSRQDGEARLLRTGKFS